MVLLAIVARVGKVVGLPEPARTAGSDESKLGHQAMSVFATSLTQTDVDMGEVVERVFDGDEEDSHGLLVRREEKIASATEMTRDGGESDQARKANRLDERVLDGEDGRVTESGLAGIGDGRPRTDHSVNEAIATNELAGKVPAATERKIKRRKKGNAIDELFAGLS